MAAFEGLMTLEQKWGWEVSKSGSAVNWQKEVDHLIVAKSKPHQPCHKREWPFVTQSYCWVINPVLDSLLLHCLIGWPCPAIEHLNVATLN